eukprot:TRINITY_DN3878_c0_g1_i4.p2 TRINITY_DN3878_c0_g1~~TRINITY_DN3878_c0_g1_i4.p2  ORF type:complete len:205 (+),score=-4.64 TRINITY_DN3878_c0_g1_i4:1002-1616(+)
MFIFHVDQKYATIHFTIVLSLILQANNIVLKSLQKKQPCIFLFRLEYDIVCFSIDLNIILKMNIIVLQIECKSCGSDYYVITINIVCLVFHQYYFVQLVFVFGKIGFNMSSQKHLARILQVQQSFFVQIFLTGDAIFQVTSFVFNIAIRQLVIFNLVEQIFRICFCLKLNKEITDFQFNDVNKSWSKQKFLRFEYRTFFTCNFT